MGLPWRKAAKTWRARAKEAERLLDGEADRRHRDDVVTVVLAFAAWFALLAYAGCRW